MSLYGALFGGVSGLRAQSSKIGVISDNIANVNTIGYKGGTAKFSSLVVNSNVAGSYQTGGVRGGTTLNISKQGLLQSTESGTDIAMSGAGFFVVKGQPNGDSSPLYTRAGSFTQDSLGNFKNSQGFYLQGWPLDREGRLPGEEGNLNTTSFTNFDSLTTVNVESASGVATATTEIALGANLKSSEVVYPGTGGVMKPDVNNPNNRNMASDAILVGAEYALAGADSVRRGDSFTVATGTGLQYTYTYGGYSTGRKVTLDSAANYGDSNTNNKALTTLNSGTDIAVSGSTLTLTVADHGLITGDRVTLSGFGGNFGDTPDSQMNSTFVITKIDDNRFSLTVATPPGATPIVPEDFQVNTRPFQGTILDAKTTTDSFLGKSTVAGFSASALTFTIENATSGTVTYTYTTTSPNTSQGQFNNLETLAKAIDATSGLTARVVDGRLVVGAEDANESVNFSNGDDAGGAETRGINWVNELGLKNVESATTNRFSSLQGLADMVNDVAEGISAVVTNPLSNATIEIRVDNPLDTISFSDPAGLPYSVATGAAITIPPATYSGTPSSPVTMLVTITDPTVLTANSSQVYIKGLLDGVNGLPPGIADGGPYMVTQTAAGTYTVAIPVYQTVEVTGGAFTALAGNKISVAGTSNHGGLLSHLGLTPSLNGQDYATAAQQPNQPYTSTGVMAAKYNPAGSPGGNMASGDITAQFSRNVRVYDSLGAGHDVRFSFIKIAQNTWAVEAHVIPETDINGALVDGQIATGTIVFNGDGTLRSVSDGLVNPVAINWRNGAVPSNVALNMGTAGQPFGTVGATVIGESDGLSQFDSSYNVNFADQNGAPVGQLVSVSITEDGTVIASYSNGETQSLYKLPIADFANPDGLEAITGNVFSQTRDSGEVNLRESGTNGTGSVVAAALEQSNVDLAEQLTDMIVAQRSYQANTKVIKTADELLEQLNQI